MQTTGTEEGRPWWQWLIGAAVIVGLACAGGGTCLGTKFLDAGDKVAEASKDGKDTTFDANGRKTVARTVGGLNSVETQEEFYIANVQDGGDPAHFYTVRDLGGNAVDLLKCLPQAGLNTEWTKLDSIGDPGDANYVFCGNDTWAVCNKVRPTDCVAGPPQKVVVTKDAKAGTTGGTKGQGGGDAAIEATPTPKPREVTIDLNANPPKVSNVPPTGADTTATTTGS